MSIPVIFKSAFDSGELYYDTDKQRIRNSRAWSNRDRKYIDRTIDDDARNIEFWYDQSGSDDFMGAVDDYTNKKELLSHLDKYYMHDKGSQGVASWDYDPSENDRAEVDNVLESQRKREMGRINRGSRAVGLMTSLVGTGLGFVGGSALRSRFGNASPIIGAIAGGLSGGGVAEIGKRKQVSRLNKRLPKTFDEYMSREILSSPIGIPKGQLPAYLKDYSVLESSGDGHAYKVKSNIDGNIYDIDNELPVSQGIKLNKK